MVLSANPGSSEPHPRICSEGFLLTPPCLEWVSQPQGPRNLSKVCLLSSFIFDSF